MKKVMLMSMLVVFAIWGIIFTYAEDSQSVTDFLGMYCDIDNVDTTLRIELDESTANNVKMTMDIFRLGNLELTGVLNIDRITGTAQIDDESAVSVEIVKTENGLKLTITQSTWLFMQLGHEYDFRPMVQEE